MAKSFIVCICVAALAAAALLGVSMQHGQSTAATPAESSVLSGNSTDEELTAPPALDLHALIERPQDAGFWYLVRANGACNTYGTDYDAQSLSRNWQTAVDETGQPVTRALAF